jgi:trigger factor
LRSEIVSQEKNINRIKVEIEEKTFQAKMEEALEEMRAKANIKGFRKGRVPRKVLQMHLGTKAIMAETLEKMIPDVIENIVKEYELDLISEPSVDVDDVKAGEPLVMTFVFETMPEVVLPELDSLEVIRKNVAVTPGMVDEAISTLRDSAAEREPVTDRSSREGDLLEVVYDMALFEDSPGEASEKSDSQKSMVELSREALPEELFSALLEKTPGDKVEVDVKIPPGDGSDERMLHYKIDVLSVAQKKLPELNGAFYEKVVGQSDLDDEGFRAKIREKLQENILAESLQRAERDALDLLAEKSHVDVPDSLVERQKARILQDLYENVKRRTGKTFEEYIAEEGLQRDKLEAEAVEGAGEIVRRSLVMEALAEREMIHVEKDDLDAEFDEMARSFNVGRDEIKEFFSKRSDDLGDLVHRVRTRKTAKRLMEKVIVREEAGESPLDRTEELKSEKEGS